MKKRVIAIDCDDVIVKTAETTIVHYNKKYGTALSLEKFYSDDLSAWGAPDDATAIKRVNAFIRTDAFIHQEPMQEAIAVIRWLKRHHELHIVTGRPLFIEQATKDWLSKHFPNTFTSAVFTNFFKLDDDGAEPVTPMTKAAVCKQIGADILIDDHMGHALDVAEAGIDVLLFGDYPWNKQEVLPNNVARAKTWVDVRRYFDA
jgi:uncharacterized HAD superfamily protein